MACQNGLYLLRLSDLSDGIDDWYRRLDMAAQPELAAGSSAAADDCLGALITRKSINRSNGH